MNEKCKFILDKINICYMLVRSKFVYIRNGMSSVRFSQNDSWEPDSTTDRQYD